MVERRSMMIQNIDGIDFKMKEKFDFSFMRQYGKVFRVFDEQDSGNICFGVEKDGQRFFVKFAGAPTAEYEGRPEDAVRRLKVTLPIYENIRHENLIRLLRAEEAGVGFAMIFDWASGKCMARMYPEDHRAVMNLPIAEKLDIFSRIIDFCETVVDAGYVAVDFYDGSIMYDEETKKTIICDIDFFQKRPYVNTVGRMWGSERFMSPEEFRTGAVVDEVTNVFTLGQMAFSLFTDSRREREVWPLSEQCYSVVFKATRGERRERFNSIAAFRKAWSEAVGLQEI